MTRYRRDRRRSGLERKPVGRLPWFAALPVAAVGGLLLDAATPGLAWWPAVFVGIVCILAAVWQQGARLGAAVGAVYGAAFWLTQISWLTLYLGPVPWLALSGMMVVWSTLFGAAAAWATAAIRSWRDDRATAGGSRARRTPRLRWVVLVQAVSVSALWVLREQIQSTWPYGGFAWGRIAHTQAESPIAQAVSWTGMAGLSGLLVLACAVPVAAFFARPVLRSGVRSAAIRDRFALRWRPLAAAGAGGLALLVVLALLPPAPVIGGPAGGDERTIRVAAVQGNAKAGIFDDRESGDVLQDHVEATRELLDGLEGRGESVDVVVWPENSAEFDLPGSVMHSRVVTDLARRADAPIVVGSVMRDLSDGDETYTNSSLVWDADGYTGERYDKRRPVPFAEYMPHRDFYHALAPDLVDLVQLEYAAGERPAAMPVESRDDGARASGSEGARGTGSDDAGDTGSDDAEKPGSDGGAVAAPFEAGIAICFDIIFDEHARAMQAADAEVVFAQTNNADFGHTDESAQQLQIARLRAVEMGRALVNVSTVGTSAIVAPDGSDLDRLTPYTADAMVAEVPLRTGTTPAMRLGPWIAGAWAAFGLASLGFSAVVTVRAHRPRRAASGLPGSPASDPVHARSS